MRALPQLLSRALVVGIAAGVVPVACGAQQPQAPISTITAGTQLVVVDVTVQDSAGNPVRGLRGADFAVKENKTPQTIKTFDEHTASDLSHIKAPPAIHLPPGTFTDYQPVPEDPTLNILLLDALNTPMKDQAYVRYQLQQYIKNEKPGTRIAIFGLTNHLILLQGFTADQETQAGASVGIVANVRKFYADNAALQTQMRIDTTINAFDSMARYLMAFPGRKNLIWFSGSFPLTIFPDPALDDPFAAQNDASDQLREASNLLARARVAVYPIDARGLQGLPMFDASHSGKAYAGDPSQTVKSISAVTTENEQEHMAMAQIAEDTGGHAFYSTNDLAAAVSKAIDSGSNYYTLTYAPTNRDPKGEYRSIQVQLAEEFASRGLKITYRHGYYADDPKARHPVSVVQATPAAAPPTGSQVSALNAMERGSPTPSEILFKVRVLPDEAGTEDAVAPGNHVNAYANVKGPFRRYDLDFAAVASDFSFPLQSDGHRHSSIEFVAMVYDADGKVLNIQGDVLDLDAAPDSYLKTLRSGIGYRIQVSAPAKRESFLRIGVHDQISGKMGVVEIPTTTIDHLPAAPPLPRPAAATPPAATPSPAVPK